MTHNHNPASTIRKVIKNNQVFNHLLKLQTKLKKEFDDQNKIEPYSEELIEALHQSPKTTLWVRDVVIPKIYDGDEGLDEILCDIEGENNIILGATKMEIILDILSSFSETLDDIQIATEQGEHNLSENIRIFEEENMPFKTLH